MRSALALVAELGISWRFPSTGVWLPIAGGARAPTWLARKADDSRWLSRVPTLKRKKCGRNDMPTKRANAQKINCRFSKCRNKTELGCRTSNRTAHGRAQGHNDLRWKNLRANMAPSVGERHVYARSRLDTFLSICVGVVAISRPPLGARSGEAIRWRTTSTEARRIIHG
jgi:hypothetical protein